MTESPKRKRINCCSIATIVATDNVNSATRQEARGYLHFHAPIHGENWRRAVFVNGKHRHDVGVFSSALIIARDLLGYGPRPTCASNANSASARTSAPASN